MTVELSNCCPGIKPVVKNSTTMAGVVSGSNATPKITSNFEEEATAPVLHPPEHGVHACNPDGKSAETLLDIIIP